MKKNTSDLVGKNRLKRDLSEFISSVAPLKDLNVKDNGDSRLT